MGRLAFKMNVPCMSLRRGLPFRTLMSSLFNVSNQIVSVYYGWSTAASANRCSVTLALLGWGCSRLSKVYPCDSRFIISRITSSLIMSQCFSSWIHAWWNAHWWIDRHRVTVSLSVDVDASGLLCLLPWTVISLHVMQTVRAYRLYFFLCESWTSRSASWSDTSSWYPYRIGRRLGHPRWTLPLVLSTLPRWTVTWNPGYGSSFATLSRCVLRCWGWRTSIWWARVDLYPFSIAVRVRTSAAGRFAPAIYPTRWSLLMCDERVLNLLELTWMTPPFFYLSEP